MSSTFTCAYCGRKGRLSAACGIWWQPLQIWVPCHYGGCSHKMRTLVRRITGIGCVRTADHIDPNVMEDNCLTVMHG